VRELPGEESKKVSTQKNPEKQNQGGSLRAPNKSLRRHEVLEIHITREERKTKSFGLSFLFEVREAIVQQEPPKNWGLFTTLRERKGARGRSG